MTDNPTDAHNAGEPARTAGADRPDVPTVREIADLTARLRDLAGCVAGADPAERAAFLADKDALINRITAALPDPPTVAPWLDRRAALERLAEPARPDDPAEIADRIAALRERITARDTRAGSAAAGTGPEIVGLVCPECGEDAIEQPPTTLVPYEALGMDRPGYSHPEGEPLCPVIGPRGYQPADPVEVTAPDPDDVATARQTVAQALADRDTSGNRPADEDTRRERLTRWHDDDQAADRTVAAHERGHDDGAGA